MQVKTSRMRNLLCALIIAALVAQGTAVAFAVSPYPEIQYLVGGEPDENGVWTPEYWVDAHGNRVDETVPRVRAAADLPSSYDLRDYGLVTSVKHQAGSGCCWAFGSIASLESSYIRQGYGTAANTDFSEAHLVWFGQNQRTTNASDPTYGDGLVQSAPFKSGGNWNRASSQLLRGSGLQLEQNAPWISTYDDDVMLQMQQSESDRYVSYARMWSVTNIRDKSATALKQKIMQNGACILSYYDDYTTTRTGYSSDRASYYQTAHSDTNHVVTVVGWDDNYPRTKFNANQRPSANGAWLIKGSWSVGWAQDGYYWISYEDPSVSEFASYVAAPADVYDHIYQYDGAQPKTNFTVPGVGKMANVFMAERTELLTHVAFFSGNSSPINVTAEVYVAPDSFPKGLFLELSNPVSQFTKVSAATTSVSGVEYGYSTVELSAPTLLTQGQMFSVVLTMTNPSGGSVNVPAEGLTVQNPGDGVLTYSGNVGESFLGYNGYWYDTNAYPTGADYNNVPLKAMTREIAQTDPTLTVASLPAKTTYRVGETFDPTGLSLEYTNEYGIAQTVTDGFTCAPQILSTIGAQTVTVTYHDLSVTLDVIVEAYETSLSLLSPPNKTNYLFGESLDTTGLTLLYSDAYGVTSEVQSGFSCEPGTLLRLGTQTVNVIYEGLSVTFDVTVEPFERQLTLLTPPNKTTYLVGESLDTTGLSLRYRNEYGVVQIVSEGFTCSVPTMQMIGVQTVTVTYEGLSVTFDVTVEPHELTLALMTAPDKKVYSYGETIDTAGLSLLYTNEFGDAINVTEGFTLDALTASVLGTQTVTVTYNGMSVTFDVTVEPLEKTLTLQTQPNRTTYFYGETIDTSGLALLYTDEYGTAFTITDGFVCDVDTLLTLGTQTVTVSYDGMSVTFDVTVEPHEPTLTLLTPPDSTAYLAGQTLDTTGLALLYTDEYGASFTVTDGFVCTPETFRVLGTQTVTVTYNGMSVTFDVTVEPLEPTLTLQFEPDKMSYLVGETLDTTGMVLFYTDEVGDALIVTEGYACDPTTFLSAGVQTVTVTYNGLSVTFDVTVQQFGQFLVANATGRAGETVEVAVRISDNPGIVAAWLEIEYDPDVLTLEGVENGDIFPDSCMTPCNDLAQIPYRVLFVDSLSGNYTQNGDLVVFTFRIRADARPGESAIYVDYDADSTYDVDLENVLFETQAGAFTVHRMPGDVNADGSIDLKDAVMLRRYLAGWDVTVNLANADVDQKEGVNLKDVTCISRYLADGYEQILL